MRPVSAYIFLIIITGALIVAPVVILQAYLFDFVLIGAPEFKMIWFFLALVSFFTLLRSARIDLRTELFLAVFFIFIGLNFERIFFESLAHGSATMGAKAFAYNFSLAPLFVVIYALLKNEQVDLSAIGRGLSMFLYASTAIASALAVASITLHSHLIPRQTLGLLALNGHIKIDQINGYVRANSLFRSPIEFGFFGVFVSSYFLSRILFCRRSWTGLIFFLFALLGVLSTLTRTIFVMELTAISILIGLSFYQSRPRRAFVSKSLIAVAGLAALLGAIFDEKIRLWIRAGIDPTNLLNRLAVWRAGLESVMHSPGSLLIGLGRVQNGEYGRFHEAASDNLYLGLIISSGLIGISLFLTFLIFLSTEMLSDLKRQDPRYKFVGYAMIAVWIGFLIGSITENTMHTFYVFLFAPLIVRLQARRCQR